MIGSPRTTLISLHQPQFYLLYASQFTRAQTEDTVSHVRSHVRLYWLIRQVSSQTATARKCENGAKRHLADENDSHENLLHVYISISAHA